MTRAPAPGYPLARDVVEARERPAEDEDGPDQDALCVCSADCGVRNVGSGRWKSEVGDDDDDALSVDPQGAYLIAPAYGFAYFSQQRAHGYDGS